MDECKKEGYWYCTRSAGSHSPFDVIAMDSDDVLLIQVKRSKKPVNIERLADSIRRVRTPPNVHKCVWVWIDGKGWAERRIIP
jgi:Holliday junction resolvase